MRCSTARAGSAAGSTTRTASPARTSSSAPPARSGPWRRALAQVILPLCPLPALPGRAIDPRWLPPRPSRPHPIPLGLEDERPGRFPGPELLPHLNLVSRKFHSRCVCPDFFLFQIVLNFCRVLLFSVFFLSPRKINLVPVCPV